MDDVSLHFCCLLCFVCLFHFIGCYLVAEYRLKSGLDSGLWTEYAVYRVQSPGSIVQSPVQILFYALVVVKLAKH